MGDAKVDVGDALAALNVRELSGRRHNVLLAREKPTILYLFSENCGFCTQNIENVKRLEAQTRGTFGFVAVGLSSVSIGSYVKAHKFSFPVYVLNYREWKANRLAGTPCTYVIDQQGKVRRKWMGTYHSKKGELEAYFGVSLLSDSGETGGATGAL